MGGRAEEGAVGRHEALDDGLAGFQLLGQSETETGPEAGTGPEVEVGDRAIRNLDFEASPSESR